MLLLQQASSHAGVRLLVLRMAWRKAEQGTRKLDPTNMWTPHAGDLRVSASERAGCPERHLPDMSHDPQRG